MRPQPLLCHERGQHPDDQGLPLARAHARQHGPRQCAGEVRRAHAAGADGEHEQGHDLRVVRYHHHVEALPHALGGGPGDLEDQLPVVVGEPHAFPPDRAVQPLRVAKDVILHVHVGVDARRVVADQGRPVDGAHRREQLPQGPAAVRGLADLPLEAGLGQGEVFLAHVLQSEDHGVERAQRGGPILGLALVEGGDDGAARAFE
mmetsp:Transcript_13623/g.40480  ORF Transcript_13623/g.40480 Transcript_13623/m.40480 type:complete len:204 (+) Transcript_13623:2024-2635(+)